MLKRKRASENFCGARYVLFKSINGIHRGRYLSFLMTTVVNPTSYFKNNSQYGHRTCLLW